MTSLNLTGAGMKGPFPADAGLITLADPRTTLERLDLRDNKLTYPTTTHPMPGRDGRGTKRRRPAAARAASPATAFRHSRVPRLPCTTF